jgi:hypothetical protein
MSEAAAPCLRCESPLEGEDLRCPVCFLATPVAGRLDRPEVTVEILRCDGCGAALSYDVRARAPKCAFCGSVVRVETSADPLEQTERFLPFAVDRDHAAAAFRRWVGTLGFFRPSDLATDARLESLEALWWVGWVFEVEALVSWTADSDQGRRRAPWAPHAGQVPMVVRDVLVPATRGLSDAEATHLTPSYRLETARAGPEGANGRSVVERFDIRRSTARRRVADTLHRMAEHELRERHVPGSRIRHLKTAFLLHRLVTRRYAFPAWVLAYRYRGRLFRTVLSGQDAGCVLGSAPRSLAKIALAAVAALLGLLLAAVLMRALA